MEAYVNGYWVPFDPLNGHFASLPSHYLELYKGDEYLFSHTPNVNFDYSFTIKQRLVADPVLLSELQSHPLNAYAAWQAFETIGIPLGLLKIIIMLPLGALIVVIFRNVIGLQTFGVFLPALIAVASRETGFFWRLLAYVIVIFLVSAIHYPLEKLFRGLFVLGEYQGIHRRTNVTLQTMRTRRSYDFSVFMLGLSFELDGRIE